MKNLNGSGLAAGLLWLALAGSAQASGSALSASSEGGSASVGSVSTSFEKSSASSSKGKDVAAGEYRVVDVAAVAATAGQQDMVRMTLQTVNGPAEGGAVVMLLPLAAAQQGQVNVGQRVRVQQRAYGYELAQADSQQAFFLVLHDTWYRELQTKAVTL